MISIRFYDIIECLAGQMIACVSMRKVRAPQGEDAVITSGVGNYRESATETHRRNGSCRGKGEIVR